MLIDAVPMEVKTRLYSLTVPLELVLFRRFVTCVVLVFVSFLVSFFFVSSCVGVVCLLYRLWLLCFLCLFNSLVCCLELFLITFCWSFFSVVFLVA